jgi:hypothetical protein
MTFTVKATIRGIGPILCSRPYPRPDHCDPFTYDSEGEAEAFAATMRARFPGNQYEVHSDKESSQ